MERIAILAGGGALPLVLADSIVERGGAAHIVAVRGEAGATVERYPHTWVTWGAVNAILTALKSHSDATMMIAGSVSRPDLMRLKPDFGVIRYLPQVLAMLRGGDDAVLTRLVRFFEGQGFAVKGVADVAPQLLAEPGLLTTAAATVAASAEARSDAALGFRVLDLLADLDVGQAIAVHRGQILAIEGVEGTDRMLARLAVGERKTAGGVLVKGPKRGQDLRVDMPTVGAQTIRGLAEAGLDTLVIVAGKTLVLERAELLRRALERGITVNAVSRDEAAGGVAPDGRPAAALEVAAGATMVGRHAPAPTSRRDAAIAAEVIRRLGPVHTGAAAVVLREHVLAIAAGETPAAMAFRVAALRQWGRGRIRIKQGAAALAVTGNTTGNSTGDSTGDSWGHTWGLADLPAMLASLAAAGIAGLALVPEAGPMAGPAPPVPPEAIVAADTLGLFLMVLA